MSLLPLAGRARKLGDDINTDYIIPSRRKKETLDPNVLRRYLLEDLDPAFAGTVEPGDILVAGENFGCGSAMEVAVTVVMGAGIKAVIAKSFSRTYLRNAFNNGLLLCVADTDAIEEGDALTIRQAEQDLVVKSPAREIACDPVPPFMLDMLQAGGLVAYLRMHGQFRMT